MPRFGRTHRYPPGKAILPHPAPSRTLPVAQNDKHTVEIRGTTTAPGCSDKDKKHTWDKSTPPSLLHDPDKTCCPGGNSSLPLLQGPKPTLTLPPPPLSLCDSSSRCHRLSQARLTPGYSTELSSCFTTSEEGVSAEGSCVPRGDFPGIMNTPGSCRGAQNAWCHQGWSPSLHSPLEKKLILAKAVFLDLAWSCASDLGLCTCLFLVPFVCFGFWAVFLFCTVRSFFTRV